MDVNIVELDRYITFCREQALRLRREHAHKTWAQHQAETFTDIEKFLLEVRRDHQMRGPGGARIDE